MNPPILRVYLAGRLSRRAELRDVAELLEDSGVVVTARWLAGGAFEDQAPDKIAEADLEDVARSNGLLFFAEDSSAGYLTGGRHVELGYALGRGLWIWVIGDRENVFHHLPRVRPFATVGAWMAHMGIA